MTDKVHGAQTLEGYKLYSPGQIVMNRMQAWSGMFGAGPVSGLVSPDYAVFNVIGPDLVDLLLARIKAPDLVGQFALASKGIGSGFNRLYSDKFGAIATSLPPTEEQVLIVRYLDHIDHRIRRYIRAKQKLIALLNERKQAIIQHAVTRVSTQASGSNRREWSGWGKCRNTGWHGRLADLPRLETDLLRRVATPAIGQAAVILG